MNKSEFDFNTQPEFEQLEQQLRAAKDGYQKIEIPKELETMINQTIKETPKRKNSTGKRTAKIAVCACLALVVAGTAALNISPAFAKAAGELPLLGRIAQVLTVVDYSREDDNAVINAKIPNIANLSDAEFQAYINDQINAKTSAILADANKRADEQREAFLATGGKEADYMPVIVDVNYEIKSQSPTILSFVVTEMETRANAFTEQYFYNLDLTDNTEITLQEMLGDNYKQLCNEQIKAQIAAREKADPEKLYFHEEDGIAGFTGIGDDQNFYINAAGNAVISFEKYEVAPGYMGIQDFEIVK